MNSAIKRTGAAGKYTTDTVELLVRAASVNISIKDACEAAGISKETYFRWMSDHPDFRDRINGARQRRRIDALERVLDAGKLPQHWTANGWYLERNWPEHYALVNRVQFDAHVIVEDVRRLAEQLGIAVGESLLAEVVDEVNVIGGEHARRR